MGLLDKVKKNKEENTTNTDVSVKVSDKKKAKKVTKNVSSSKSGKAYRIMVKPHISEKSAYGEANGVYTFVIEREATKVDVKQAMQEIYGVTPKKVRVIHMDGKKVRFGKTKGRRKDWKKAIITLPKGKHIDIHAGV